ncbi:kinase-interacting protein 1-like [Cornus florida]|uniref:kinase-interacting protein 1-like n=1 Tax=Cornus florida TaxID=4283 RepID=UPI0028A27BAD|nr:kinase-interacting protein 1-like [Cornus florida]
MLHRAAQNAYSWWWASHIRTKQSKWLEQSLQDMEEKVQDVLKLIEQDGDSFAKRAEMYYKRRPELISFVEETFRAYRALADRYDLLSKDLQNANTTIATVFPEQVQFAMDDEEECGGPIKPKNSSQVPPKNVPAVPKVPNKELRGLIKSATRQMQSKKSSKTVPKSGLSKSEAVEEIDNSQKEILALQTEKEFIKSSYENGLAKFKEIEKRITEKQMRVFSLQDEFGVARAIEDDEARTLMAESALKSCQKSLATLEVKQENTTKDAKAESKRIEDAHEKLKILRKKFLPDQTDQEKQSDKFEAVKVETKSQSLNQEGSVTKERRETEVKQEKIKDHLEVGSYSSLTVEEMAEKIDQLVNKVISLENAVSSQTALMNRLRTETDDLHAQIRILEDGKATLIYGTDNVSNTLTEMEEKLNGIQDLNRNVECQNNNLQTQFTETRCSFDHLSEKLHSVKPDEEVGITDSVQEKNGPLVEVKSPKMLEKQDMPSPSDGCVDSRDLKPEVGEDKGDLKPEVREDKRDLKPEVGEDTKEQVPSTPVKDEGEEEEEKVIHSCSSIDIESVSQEQQVSKSSEEVDKHGISHTSGNVNAKPWDAPQEAADSDWQQMLLEGVEDKEKILMTEYATMLRNYKEAKKKISEAEKKNRDSVFAMAVQLRQLKSTIAKRDEEIQSLRQKLNLVEASFDGSKDLKDDKRTVSDLSIDQTTEISQTPLEKKEEDEDINLIVNDEDQAMSPIEEKLRKSIDEILEENLDFWLRFSTSFHQIQKFKTEVQDLQDEISKIKEKEKSKQEGSTKADLRSDVRPIYKHLREIRTELTVWLEHSGSLKDELQHRIASICNILDEITEALNEGVEEEDMKFTSYQAAKFQGEVMNMKQENDKVSDELQAGLDHVTALQLEIEKTLEKLNKQFGLNESKNQNQPQLEQSTSRPKVPLSSFIFGVKPKKQKHSFFHSMNYKKSHEQKNGSPM